MRIAVDGTYPPFSLETSIGKLIGVDIDIAHALCDAMGVECTLVKQSWDQMIPGLEAKEYDAIIASMVITEERKKEVAFSDKYYSIPAKFVARKGVVKGNFSDALKGKKVGVSRGSAEDKYLTDNYGKDIVIERYLTRYEAHRDMDAGKIDFFFANALMISNDFMQEFPEDAYEFVGPNVFSHGMGIAVRKEDTALLEKFNDALKKIRANGVYDEIRNKYFDFDIDDK